MKKIIFSFLAVFVLYGCVRRESCTLPPIPDNVFDINKIPEKNIILTSGKDIDSLIFIEKWDSYEEESVKALMNYRECEHSKGYNYNFRDETITVSLLKSDDEKLTLDLNAFFNTYNSEIEVKESDILNTKEFIFSANNPPSDISKIKEIVFKGEKIIALTTTDDKTWSVRY